MTERIPFPSHRDEREQFKARLTAAALFIIVLSLVLLLRYFSLQVLQYEDYRTQSERNRVHLQPVPPSRGLIYDRGGVLLADNRPSSTLVAISERVGDIDAALAELQKLIDIEPEDVEKFRQQVRNQRPFELVPLKFRLTEEEIAILAVNRYRLAGFEVKAELARYYTQGPYFAHVLGYVGRISESEQAGLDAVNYSGTHVVGKTGIEKFYEDTLHGRVGYENVETNARGRVLRALDRTDPQRGRDLILSIDADTQRVAYQALGDQRGAVVAIDPNNGDVIAFVSTPGFDPNLFVGGISGKDYRALNDSPDLPLYNRATMGQYPPGSTVKPLMGLAGLEYELVTPFTVVADPGWYRLPNDRRHYRDWKRGGHGRSIDLHAAIEQSCDIYFYTLAYKLGVDRIHAFNSQFGLGRASGIDLPIERAGLLPSQAWKRERRREPWYPGETLSVGIGQGYLLATPLQLAVATAAIASRGKLFRPRILKSISQEIPEPPQFEQVELNNPANWDEIWRGMEAVVHGPKGTAKGISRDVSYRIAGKTGTAQVIGIAQGENYDASSIAERHRDHALFIAFAPVERPRIALAVVVENGEHGSSTAAPVARRVMDTYLQKKWPVSAGEGELVAW